LVRQRQIFVAPFVLIHYSGPSVAQAWALGLAVIAIAFWYRPRTIPTSLSAAGTSARAALATIQAWWFGLHYFLTFGRFVALSL
jgi:NNP family nitrate/nitrite transporter-like MFS transporter